MKKTRVALFSILCLFTNLLLAQNIQKPFPQHVKYSPGTIKPNHITQTQLDNSVKGFYTQWKKHYIKYARGMLELNIWHIVL